MTYSFRRSPAGTRLALALGAAGIAACADTPSQPSAAAGPSLVPSTAVAPLAGRFSEFRPLASSATCNVVAPPATIAGFAAYQPLLLPEGYAQTIITTERDAGVQQAGTGANNFDMLTFNETGPDAGRYLYRTHETGTNGALSVTDIQTGQTRIAAQASHYEALDGIVWTPWGTVLFAEERIVATLKDPAVPDAVGGLLYEYDPATRTTRPLPAFGARSHEGLRFDAQGNLYGISESTPGTAGQSGALFKFTPDRAGDLTSGQLYALKVADSASRTGAAAWVPLDRQALRVNSDLEAIRVGATGWGRPEDVEIETRGGVQSMYVSSTSERLVLRVELRGDAASVSNYVREGVNVTGLNNPDNLELDAEGNLYIAEDFGPADVWFVRAAGGTAAVATEVTRFASLTDCAAEVTGIYFDAPGTTLYLNVQHAGGPLANDLTMAVTRTTSESGNATPTITNFRLDPAAGPVSVSAKACGGRYTACVRFTLADPDGPSDAPFKTVVAWGDGSVWAPNTVPADRPLVAPHDYAAPGVYPVRVTVTDRRGASSMQTLLLQVQP
jgi:hypothetical protein